MGGKKTKQKVLNGCRLRLKPAKKMSLMICAALRDHMGIFEYIFVPGLDDVKRERKREREIG